MATVLTAPNRLTKAQRQQTTTVFLAGPFEDDDGTEQQTRSWRDDVIDGLTDLDITIIDPRNPRWHVLEPGSPGRRGAYEWQCASAIDADVVIVWVPTGRRAPTALMILGALGVKRNNARLCTSVIVGGGGWDGLVGLFAQNSRFFPLGDDLGEVIRVARARIESSRPA